MWTFVSKVQLVFNTLSHLLHDKAKQIIDTYNQDPYINKAKIEHAPIRNQKYVLNKEYY